MQNEFEKQVQQKMEELKLVPSDPVWQKVEMQIRSKKDRRRLIFWIPLLLVLLGGGLWMGIDYSSKNISYNTEAKNSRKNKNHAPLNQVSITKINQGETEKATNKTEAVKHSGITSAVSLKQSSLKQRSMQKLIPKNENSFSTVEQKSNADGISLIHSETAKEISIQPEEKTPDTISEMSKGTEAIVNNENKTEIAISKADSLSKDSSSIVKPEIKKHKEAKWKYALLVNAGTSGLNHLNLFNGEKSLASTPNYNGGSTSGGGPVYYGPSAVKNNFSFAIGAIIQRQIGQRTSFSAGLQYNYYSNIIYVGSRITQNTVIADFSVSQYYSNRSVAQQAYRNQYHFVSLPAGFEWQLLKKNPLNFYTGLSLQYLVQTNALRFDYNSQSYFHSKDAFNSTQVFSEFGITYSLPKQQEITFGPQLQYGLSKLEKGNSTNHLFSYGVKAQWQLRKK